MESACVPFGRAGAGTAPVTHNQTPAMTTPTTTADTRGTTPVAHSTPVNGDLASTTDGAVATTIGNENEGTPRSSASYGDFTFGTFNSKSFKQNSEYVVDLLCNCDVLCLCETWLRPGELDCIKQVVNHHPKLSDANLSVFAKSSMEDCPGSFLGRPFGGLAIIARSRDNVCFKEIAYDCDRIALVSVNYDEK